MRNAEKKEDGKMRRWGKSKTVGWGVMEGGIRNAEGGIENAEGGIGNAE